MSDQVLPQSIIVVPAQPAAMTPAELEYEAQLIRQGLIQSRWGDRLSVTAQWICNWDDLRSLISHAPPTILQVCGSAATQAASQCAQSSANSVTPSSWLTDPELCPADWAISIACVVFKAGYCPCQARAIAQQSPFVVGLAAAIAPMAADEFMRRFYQALGDRCAIKLAYHAACRTLLTPDLPKQLAPVLLQRPTRIYLSFLDHNPDVAIAQQVANALRAYGYAPVIAPKSLLSEDVQSAAGCAAPLIEALASHLSYDYMVLILSAASLSHETTLDEMRWLQATARPPSCVLPICIQLAAAKSLPPPVQHLLQQYAPRNWTHPCDTDNIIRELLHRLTDAPDEA